MCWHRTDNSPPSWTWTFSTINVGAATVRYHNPAGALGLVMLFDGGAGATFWSKHMEERLQVEALVDAGYAVAALPSEDPNIGDYDMNPDYGDNHDLQNVDGTIAALGFVDKSLYYLGFSSGGTFASLATVTTSAKALALFGVRGLETTYLDPQLPPPPTLWIVGRHDSLVPPTDYRLIARWAAMEAMGVDWAFYVNEPAGLLPEAFVRLSDPNGGGVDPVDSANAVADLVASGQLDACSVPIGREINWGVVDFGQFQAEAERQVKELYGSHTVTSDFRQQVVDFFLTHQ